MLRLMPVQVKTTVHRQELRSTPGDSSGAEEEPIKVAGCYTTSFLTTSTMTTPSTGQPIMTMNPTTETGDDTLNITAMPRSAEVPPPRKRGRTSSRVKYLHNDNSNNTGLLFATTPTSAGSTSSCSDRDSSPDIMAFRSSIMPPTRARDSTTALTCEGSTDASLSMYATNERESGGAAAGAAGLEDENDSQRNSTPDGGDDFRQASKRYVGDRHQAHGRCSSSSSYDSGTEGEQIGIARLTRMKGKKRMRFATSVAANSTDSGDSTDSAAISSPYSVKAERGTNDSRPYYVSAAARRQGTEPSDNHHGKVTTPRSPQPPGRPRYSSTRPITAVDAGDPASSVAAAAAPALEPASAFISAPSPAVRVSAPPPEVLDLSAASPPLITEVIDIDMDDGPSLAMQSPPECDGGRRLGGSPAFLDRLNSMESLPATRMPGRAGTEEQARVAATSTIAAASSRGGASAVAGVAVGVVTAPDHRGRLPASTLTMSPPRASTGRLSATLRPLGVSGRPSYSNPGVASRSAVQEGEGGDATDNECSTIGVVRRRRQQQQDVAGSSVGRSVAREKPSDSARVAARLQQLESKRQEQSDLEMARQLQSEEDAGGAGGDMLAIQQAMESVAEVGVMVGSHRSNGDLLGSSAGMEGYAHTISNLGHFIARGEEADDELDIGVEVRFGEQDDSSSDGGVFAGGGVNGRARSSSSNPAAAAAAPRVGGRAARSSSSRGASAGTSSSSGSGRPRRRATPSDVTPAAAPYVVDLGDAASDDDAPIPGTTASDSTRGAQASTSSRPRGAATAARRGGRDSRVSSSTASAQGSTRNGSSGRTSASRGRRVRSGRGGAAAPAAGAGRGAYGHIDSGSRTAGAAGSPRRGAGRSTASAGAAAQARRRRQGDRGNFLSRQYLEMMQMSMALLERSGVGVGGAASGRGRGSGGGSSAYRGVAGSAAHLALMTRNITPADYQELLALDDHNHGGGGCAKPKGLRAAEISMLPTQTGNGSGEVEQCCICMDDMKPRQSITRLPGCLHTFHSNCIKKWLREQACCPIDKTPVSVTD